MDRLLFEAEDEKLCDSIQITGHSSDALYVSVENEWAGCTETGFGAVASFALERSDVLRLVDFLGAWLSATDTPPVKAEG